MKKITVQKLVDLGFENDDPEFSPEHYVLDVTGMDDNHSKDFKPSVLEVNILTQKVSLFSSKREEIDESSSVLHVTYLVFKHIDTDEKLELFINLIMNR